MQENLILPGFFRKIELRSLSNKTSGVRHNQGYSQKNHMDRDFFWSMILFSLSRSVKKVHEDF